MAGLVGFAPGAQAQEETGQVTVNLTFLPVQTIAVTPAQKTVEVLYATVDDYQNGVAVTQDDHLTVFSTGGFLVSVQASDANFTRVGGSETIPVGDITVKAFQGTGNQTPAVFASAPLSASSGTPLITSEKGGRDLKYGVTYDNTAAGGENKYIDKFTGADKEGAVYTSEVTYTITTP